MTDALCVTMPGVLADFVSEPASEAGGAVLAALDSAKYVRRGRGYSLEVTAAADVLDFFSQRAGMLLALRGSGEVSAAELSAARKWIARVDAALREQ